MVMIKNSIRAAVIPLALSSFLVLDGCKEDEVAPQSQTDLLIGDWEVTEAGGDDYTQSDESILFKFKSSGDWQFCYEYDLTPADNYCYGAKWKWQDSDEKVIIIDQFSGDPTSEFKLDVVVLTATNLEGTLTSTYDDGGTPSSYSQTVKFVKIN